MIRSLTFTPEAATSVIPWWDDCKAWKGKTSFTFRPGLTLLVGPNGTGKTALFKLLARLLLAEQGGKTAVTGQAVADYRKYQTKDIQLDHDGQGIWHLDLMHQPGLVGGMAAFDFDFMDEAMGGIQASRASAGQNTLMRLDQVLKAAVEGKAPEVTHKGRSDARGLKDIQAMLKGSGEKGPPTFLLDEPDRNIDGENQARLWSGLERLSKTCQLIIISHSPLPLLRLPPEAVLETEEGYAERTRGIVRRYLGLV